MYKFAMKVMWESGYIMDGRNGKYLVTMEKLKSTYYGQPRYKAKITKLISYNEPTENGYKSVASILWKGHYKSEEQEAHDILDEYEMERENEL